MMRTRANSGVALIIVLLGLIMITAVVAELSYEELVQYKVAIYERDAAKAEALASGGVEIAELLLIIQAPIQDQITKVVVPMLPKGITLPALTIWNLLPLDSGLLKGLATGEILDTLGMDITDSLKKRKEAKAEKDKQNEEGEDEESEPKVAAKDSKKKAKKSPTKPKKSNFDIPDGGFGAFDGSFSVKISDEESKISIRNWANTNNPKERYRIAMLLQALMAPTKYDALFTRSESKDNLVDRISLIGNIYDYIDADDLITDPTAPEATWGTRGSGSEKSLYAGDNVVPKNSFFDSMDELRLVRGMTDDIYDTFSDAITLYGQGGVNILSASNKVLEALARYCANEEGYLRLLDSKVSRQMMADWKTALAQQGGGITVDGWMAFLKQQLGSIDADRCKAIMTTTSSNFTIKSSATVGDVTRTTTAVVRFTQNAVEELYYFRTN